MIAFVCDMESSLVPVARYRRAVDERVAISELSEAALAAWLLERGQPAYRARQIRRHAARTDAAGWADLTDLPLRLRDELARSFRWSSVEAVAEQASADGETRKALLSLKDGHRIETVLMPHHGARNSVCISTQAGCPMACSFCATGEMGLIRNLTAGEIVDQVRHWQRTLAAEGDRVSHVVYMGMGEPFNNYDATLASARTLMDPEAFGISPRRITISTCGVVPKIDALAEEGLPINLAISLHAPVDSIRTAIMPINKRWNIDEVLASAARYVKRTKRRVTFEYILLGGVNDSAEAAALLAKRITEHLRPGAAHVNLIPYNPGPGGYRRPSVEMMERFAQILDAAGIAATVRISKGQDIAAACGQLKVPEGKAAPVA
jgi:23S rRNA (adenine2503-C2)-methyltransferase